MKPSPTPRGELTEEFRDSLTRTADWLENLLTEQRAGPGKNYTQPRSIQVDVWDNCDDGGESVDGFTFDDGEVEYIVALIRASLAVLSETEPSDEYRVLFAAYESLKQRHAAANARIEELELAPSAEQESQRQCLRALTDGRCSYPHCACPPSAALQEKGQAVYIRDSAPAVAALSPDKHGEENWQRMVRLLRDPRATNGRPDILHDAASMIERLVRYLDNATSAPSATPALQQWMRDFIAWCDDGLRIPQQLDRLQDRARELIK